jgi:hypothetical protein
MLSVLMLNEVQVAWETASMGGGAREPPWVLRHVAAWEPASVVRWSHHGLEPCGSTGARLCGEAE